MSTLSDDQNIVAIDRAQLHCQWIIAKLEASHALKSVGKHAEAAVQMASAHDHLKALAALFGEAPSAVTNAKQIEDAQ